MIITGIVPVWIRTKDQSPSFPSIGSLARISKVQTLRPFPQQDVSFSLKADLKSAGADLLVEFYFEDPEGLFEQPASFSKNENFQWVLDKVRVTILKNFPIRI